VTFAPVTGSLICLKNDHPITPSTAEAYAKGQSEVVMGEAIKELGWKRSDVVLSTKIFWVSTAACLHCCKYVFSRVKRHHQHPGLCCCRVPAADLMTRASAASTSSRAPRCMTGRNPIMYCANFSLLCGTAIHM
jgi:hypothetical protein